MTATTVQGTKSTPEADRFSAIFRDEHREVRDLLLDLIGAYRSRETGRIPGLLNEIARCTGPHFRYEEVSLYPALVQFFGPDYVRELYHAHDRAIATAKELVALAGKDALSDEDVERAIRGVRAILPHVTDCDGLSVLVERLPSDQVLKVLATRDKTRSEGLDLLAWERGVRSKESKRDAVQD